MFHRKTPQKKWKCLKNQAVEDWGWSKMFSFCGFWNDVSRFFLRIHVDSQDNYTFYRYRILRCALGSFWYLTPIYTSCFFFSSWLVLIEGCPHYELANQKGAGWSETLLFSKWLWLWVQSKNDINRKLTGFPSRYVFFRRAFCCVSSICDSCKAPDLTSEISTVRWNRPLQKLCWNSRYLTRTQKTHKKRKQGDLLSWLKT